MEAVDLPEQSSVFLKSERPCLRPLVALWAGSLSTELEIENPAGLLYSLTEVRRGRLQSAPLYTELQTGF